MDKRARSRPNYNEMCMDSDSDSDFGTSSKKPDSKLSLRRKMSVKERAELAQLQRALELSKQEALKKRSVPPEEHGAAGPSGCATSSSPHAPKDVDVIADSESDREGEGQTANAGSGQERTVQVVPENPARAKPLRAAGEAAGPAAATLVTDASCEPVLDECSPTTKFSPANLAKASPGSRYLKSKRKARAAVLSDSSSGSEDDDWHEGGDDFNAEEEDDMGEEEEDYDDEEEETPKKKKKKATKAKPAKETGKAKKQAAPKGESKSKKKTTGEAAEGFTTPSYPATHTPALPRPYASLQRPAPAPLLSRPPEHCLTASAPAATSIAVAGAAASTLRTGPPLASVTGAAASSLSMATPAMAVARPAPAVSAPATVPRPLSTLPSPATPCPAHETAGGSGGSGISTGSGGGSSSGGGGSGSTPLPKLASGTLMCRLLTQSAPRIGLSRRYRPPPLHPQLHSTR
eukprot:jgi/Mesvir1/9566/Mv12746-RA.1